MAFYPISDQQSIKTFLAQYVWGEDCQIIACYTARTHHTCRFQLKNSSDANAHDFLLLAVEPPAQDHLVFTAALVDYLIAQGIPVTPCIKNNHNEYLSLLGQYPALLFQLPDGQFPNHHDEFICQQIGAFLGKMHTKSRDFTEKYGNTRSLVWLNLSADELLPQLSIGDASLLNEQLVRFKSTIDRNPNLPTGALIGSLFKDQLFFRNNQLQAVTGFYFSCTDWLLFDVAQAVNEWCCNEQGELDKSLTKALLTAYHKERPFTEQERQHWQDILCFSATRFWVSRLLTALMPEQAGCPSIKHDPDKYKQKLKRRITGFYPLPL
jgi:homoserine kinase type II